MSTDYWTQIILEGHCLYDLTRQEKLRLVGLKRKKIKVVDNPHYTKESKPGWCKNRITYQCLSKSCPFFAYMNAEKADYAALDRRYKGLEKKI